jgi:predicted O-methyltransferase YrrM
LPRPTSRIRRKVAASRLATLGALPERVGIAAAHNAAALSGTVRWLVRSREHTNFTYELTTVNREQLAWWVAEVTGCEVLKSRELFAEVENDDELREHIKTTTRRHPRWRLANPSPPYGRRVAWYALVRLLRPEHVVETGSDKGLGSVLVAAALRRNGSGTLTTIDINPDAGYLLAGHYAEFASVRVGDSREILAQLSTVDLSIHDSVIDEDFETSEIRAIGPRLSAGAVVISDIAHASLALPRWSESEHRRYVHFQEMPLHHWYRGDAMGASIPVR